MLPPAADEPQKTVEPPPPERYALYVAHRKGRRCYGHYTSLRLAKRDAYRMFGREPRIMRQRPDGVWKLVPFTLTVGR